jgi:hypothetical protein
LVLTELIERQRCCFNSQLYDQLYSQPVGLTLAEQTERQLKSKDAGFHI